MILFMHVLYYPQPSIGLSRNNDDINLYNIIKEKFEKDEEMIKMWKSKYCQLLIKYEEQTKLIDKLTKKLNDTS